MEHENAKKENSFIRWQHTTIRQMTYTTNVILALATGVLGFAVGLLKDANFFLFCWEKWFFDIGCLFLLFSIGLGIWLVINRLKDFRITMKIARRRERGEAKEKLQPLRDVTKRLGKRTWRLLHGQIGFFGLGVIFLILSIFIVFKNKVI